LALAELDRVVRGLDQNQVPDSPVLEGENVDRVEFGAVHPSSLAELGR
jgi:hypothetical protein